ncbi:toxin-activating lysine-acyltransferase [Roseovarius sp. CH_XMU1461]|uniref:toxin-activating lysine-acyltransferase n=1 Tax=Roseovarius sp. CH_XMU1461 TaxID=3107777 RepID=UPI003008B284
MAQDDERMDAQTFGSTIGNAVWLMTMDKAYRDRQIREVEAIVATPILLRQFKLYSKDNQPVAFLTWAGLSDDAKARLEAGETLGLEDWRSGENLTVVDVVSPFNPADVFRQRFWKSAQADA